MPELRDATVRIGVAGLNGTGITSGEKLDITTRLTAIEGTTIPAVLNDLTDADTVTVAPVTGDLLEYDGTNWVPSTPASTTLAFAIPFAMGDGSTAIPATFSIPWQGLYIPAACTITGYAMDADGAVSVVIERALAATPRTYAVISGSETPTLAAAGTTSDTSLTTWTTALAAGDRIRATVTGTPVAWSATLNLLLTRTL